jgi:hypothetical protein
MNVSSCCVWLVDSVENTAILCWQLTHCCTWSPWSLTVLCMMLVWLIYIWVRDLTVPMHLDLNWRALCAPYQFKGALFLCWNSRWPTCMMLARQLYHLSLHSELYTDTSDRAQLATWVTDAAQNRTKGGQHSLHWYLCILYIARVVSTLSNTTEIRRMITRLNVQHLKIAEDPPEYFAIPSFLTPDLFCCER